MTRGSWAVEFDARKEELKLELHDASATYEEAVVEAALSELLHERRIRDAKQEFAANHAAREATRRPLVK
ncbi:hypothetical protein [Haloarchaeobius sp. TZWWS8]|uniref:hypothetical protein n=1 Tax=Haloarchaeobius sp. TZWWS8 TaxID=3446121 RepID=UPI003EB706AB